MSPRLYLFSFGTLQDPVVQREVFGRELHGDLAAADDYEVDDYARTEVTLASGTMAWVYLDKTHLPEDSQR